MRHAGRVMHGLRSRRGLLLAAAMLLGAAALPAQAGCEAGRPVEFPLTADIDRQAVVVPIVLAVPAVRFDARYDAFRGQATAPDDRRFAQLVDGLRARDASAVQGLKDAVHEVAEAKDVGAFVQLWSTTFKLETMTVLLKACVKDVALYFWQVDTQKGPYVRQFTFLPARALEPADLQQVLTVGRLLRGTLQHQTTEPGGGAAAIKAAVGKVMPMRLASDLATRSPAAYEVRLQPGQVATDGNALKPVARADAVVQVFDASAQSLRRGDDAQFKSLLSEPGRRKYATWWDKMPPSEREAFKAAVSDVQPVLRLSAAPLHMVYFVEDQDAVKFRDTMARLARRELNEADAATALQALKFKVVQLQEREKGRFQVVNLWAEDFVYDFLTERDGFVRQTVIPEIIAGHSRRAPSS